MMQLGFVSAILPDLSLEQTLAFAAEKGFKTVEAMCWPVGKKERRYAGVTHLDLTSFDEAEAQKVKNLLSKYDITLSALGYYPNILCADEKDAAAYIEHLKKVIRASSLLGLNLVNTFIGRDHTRSLQDNWSVFDERWPEIIRFAESSGVKIAIENCPMLFSQDEWPGGKNLAVSPKIWREMFTRIPSAHFGLNYDPSHLIWQFMDPVRPIHEFRSRIFHVHAKDLKIWHDRLDDVGIMDFGWNTPKLPGLGDVNWPDFFAALTDIRYEGAVCIEVEDAAYEGSLAARQQALVQSKRFLDNYV
jgi:sugar phosphate isomerase/epimerase